MGLWTTFLLIGALFICQARPSRIRRQAPDYKSEDTVEDYAGNENVPDYAGGKDKNDEVAATNDNDDDNIADYVGLEKDEPKEEPKDTLTDTLTDPLTDPLTDTFTDPYKAIDNDINEDRFEGDKFEDDAPNSPNAKEEEKNSGDSDESKRKKHPKKNKYFKKTFKKVSEFLKKVLDPNKLMENAYVTEMLRRFSDHDTKEVESRETEEHHEHHEIPIPKKRKRRGRPKKEKIPPGIGGLIKKGILSLTQMEVDKKKLKRRVRLIKRIARKAKKPLKTAVKIFLSSRNQGAGGGYGGAGGYNNNY